MSFCTTLNMQHEPSLPQETITKNPFKTKSSVGLMLTGVAIDTIVIGGPAHAMGNKISKGDRILSVDGKPATPENVLSLLVGNDEPECTYQIEHGLSIERV